MQQNYQIMKFVMILCWETKAWHQSHGISPESSNFNKDPDTYNNQGEFRETETIGKDQIMRLSFKT